MKFKAQINVVPNEENSDNNSKKVMDRLRKAHINNIENISVGRFYSLEIEANSYNAASAFVHDACTSVLAKKDNELFDFTITEI